MGIRINCPGCGHKMNLKSFLAGKRGVCPKCHTKFDIPAESDGDAGGGEESQIATVQANGAAPANAAPAPQPVARQSPSPASVNPQHAGQPQPTPVQPQPRRNNRNRSPNSRNRRPFNRRRVPWRFNLRPCSRWSTRRLKCLPSRRRSMWRRNRFSRWRRPARRLRPTHCSKRPTRRGTCGRLQADSLAPPKAT